MQLSNRTQHYFALGGMAGPIVFSMAVVILGFLEPEYSHIEQAVSALGDVGSTNPLLQTMNFILFGLLELGLALGLYTGMNDSQGRRRGYISLGFFGIGLIATGVFPADEGGVAVTFSGQMHDLAAAVAFLGAILAIFLIREEMKKDERWSDLSRYSLITGIIAFSLLILFGSQISNTNAPFHDASGLLQRLLIVSLFQWFFVTGNRLRKLSG